MNKHVINILMLIKVSCIAYKKTIIIKKTQSSFYILRALYKEGLIQNFLNLTFSSTKNSKILIFLRYFLNNSVCNNIKLLSKPSKYVYLSFNDVCILYDKNHLLFLSTNKGILTNFECKVHGIGGLALFIC